MFYQTRFGRVIRPPPHPRTPLPPEETDDEAEDPTWQPPVDTEYDSSETAGSTASTEDPEDPEDREDEAESVGKTVAMPAWVSLAHAADVAFRPQTLLEFHGADARVEGWRDEQRAVQFTIEVPSRLRFAVAGAKTATVEVRQKRETHPDRVTVVTRGRLVGLALPIDTMSPTFRVRMDRATHGVVVDGEIDVSAPAFPQPVRWVVEKVAAAKAQADLRAFVNFVVTKATARDHL